MRLRSITLSGFKTFARQTEIGFDPGVTAIVGPNGSGKSNTVDAFKWVLGETQARDLRGRKMEDVIYAGGERRPRAAAAEATILIDNSDHRLPLDYEEVAIRRRLDRSGQSDYFLNGSRVRRRDLLDLLASTGLTTDSYAIVDQRDIEHIIGCTPEERRLLIEEAAQVRGVKARRTEAAAQLRDLAGNLTRLEDVRGEIEPRLEALRGQALAAREAGEARRRLELLRGSIAWEEWREARDAHRRTAAQAQAIERRLAATRLAADEAEAEYRRCRAHLQAAQDRRMERQQVIGARRLELQQLEHEAAILRERSSSHVSLARSSRDEAESARGRLDAARTRRSQMAEEFAAAEAALAAVPDAAPAPADGDASHVRAAQREAQEARRTLAAAQTALASVRTRRRLLEENLARLTSLVLPAETALAAIAQKASEAAQAAQAARAAAAQLARLRAELEGLQALLPASREGFRRLSEVIVARPGYEAALSAALGSLADAWAAADEPSARAALKTGEGQATVLWPEATRVEVESGSLLGCVTWLTGYEELAKRLLGGVVLGRDVSRDGVYREPGLLRSGPNPGVELALRRLALQEAIAGLEPAAAAVSDREAQERSAQLELSEIRAAAGQRARLDETAGHLESARRREAEEMERLSRLDRAAAAAEAAAADLAQGLAEKERLLAEHRAEVRRLELERIRWSERVDDLKRQLRVVDGDLADMERTCVDRLERARELEQQAALASAQLPRVGDAIAAARLKLAEAEALSPGEDAELAEAARRLVGVEEGRVEARLAVSTLEGNFELLQREAQLALQRMEELRARMPEGLAPEEVPGGKAREREMRQLERRLEEIGPTNPLAETECAELEDRYTNLLSQLTDIAAAREDLEQLISRLREEEDSRYQSVLGAVAAGFQEYFAELSGGGQATLRQAAGDDGPNSGVEMRVQPPRKRMQSVSLLSSGERALTSLALVLALQQVNPAPFTILDEVDAALDDANVVRFGEVLARLGRQRQFLLITHNHVTMASASALYGVHLDESGSSHLVSVRLEDVQPVARREARTA